MADAPWSTRQGQLGEERVAQLERHGFERKSKPGWPAASVKKKDKAANEVRDNFVSRYGLRLGQALPMLKMRSLQ